MKSLPFKLRQRTQTEKWRARTFWEKEPDTLAWIGDFDLPGGEGVFWDIGANIGIFSLYAASLHKGITVIAFEPIIANIEALAANILANNFKNVFIVSGAVVSGWAKGTVTLAANGVEAGMSAAVDHRGSYKRPVECLALRTEGLPGPDYVKIDTDGSELDILRAIMPTLSKAKGVMVEAERNAVEINAVMQRYGFKMDNRYKDHTPLYGGNANTFYRREG